MRQVEAAGIDTSLFTTSTRATASYTAILESTGELVIGLADMDIYDEITPDLLAPALPRLREHALWFLECNLPEATIAWLLEAARDIPVAVDAISVAKSRKLAALIPRIPLLFCNIAQAAAIAGVDGVHALQAAGARAGVVSAGARGIAVWCDGHVVEMPALKARPRDVTGAGDALVSGTLFGLSQGLPLPEAARWGLAAAAITVESEFAAVPGLTRDLLEARL
jgi:pseudouridine kinase